MSVLNVFERLLSFFHLASCIPLAALIAITTSDVFFRYLFASSVPDAIELNGLMLGLCISLALAPVTYSERQIRLEILFETFPWWLQEAANVLSRLTAAGVFFIMAWQAWGRTQYSRNIAEYVGRLETPIWPFKAVFALGCSLTFLALVVMLARMTVKFRENSGK